MNWNTSPIRVRTSLPVLLLALCTFVVPLQEVVAQPYGLRSSTWVGQHSTNTWFDCRNWDNAVPDEYTAATVVGVADIPDNGFGARAATLTIDATSGGLVTLQPGASLTITAETSTPASTRRYDEMTWLTTHNAHTAYDYNVLYAQQHTDIPDQLADGVRGLMIDAYDWSGPSGTDVYLCHADCAIPFINPNTLSDGSAVAAVVSIAAIFFNPVLGGPLGAAAALGVYVLADTAERLRLQQSLEDVKAFLDANQDAIITLIIEDRASLSNIHQQFVDAGLNGYMYDPGVDGPNGTTGCWPSLQWMRDNDKRLVVFVQSSTPDLDGRILGQFAYTVENTYNIGVSDYDPTCTNRGESAALNDRSRKLFVMNHFSEITVPTEYDVETFLGLSGDLDIDLFEGNDSPNKYSKLLSRVDNECYTAAQRYPNFIALDFYQYPEGDAMDVVNEINGRWRPDAGTTSTTTMAASVPREASPESAAEASVVLDEVAAEEMVMAPVALPESYALSQNYPNPFNPSTEIAFALPEAVDVRLVVYDVLGREVVRLVDGPMGAGLHSVRFEAADLPSGTYLYRIEAGTFTETRHMALIK